MIRIDALVVATERFAWNLSVKLAKNTVPYRENEQFASNFGTAKQGVVYRFLVYNTYILYTI